MPRKRALAAWCASRTGATASPRRRFALPTIAVAARTSRWPRVALSFAIASTNSVSPMTRSSSGPSVRYIEEHSMKTVWRTLCAAVSATSSSSR
jgi:hypothetical protein